jgi:hypothetical protein
MCTVGQDVFAGVQGTGQTFDRQGFEAREKGLNHRRLGHWEDVDTLLS